MPAILLYLATTAGLIALWRRYVQPITLATAIVLVLLPLCFTGRALLTGRVHAPIDLPFMSEPLKDYKADYGIATDYGEGKVHNGTLSDLYLQMIPWQSAVRQSLLKGEWPLWNPYMLCGSVLAANMQSTVYDPLHLLSLVLAHPQALTFNAAMTLFLAGFFAFCFARTLGLNELASLFGAAGFMFCELLAFFMAWPLGRAWAIFPLLLLGVRFVVRETSVRSAVLLTTSFVLLIVAGHPESVLHVTILGMVYGVYELATTRRDRRFHKAIGLAVLCGAIALALTAILLMPFFEAAPQTGEYWARQEFLAQEPFKTPAGMIARRAGLTFFPWYGGQPERDNHTNDWEPTHLRVGGLVIALAISALLLAPRRDTWFFAGLALFCAWSGFNAWPVAHLLHALPGFDITINDRLAFGGAFCLAMLAAIAVDAWPRERNRALVVAGVVATIAVALGIGTLLLRERQIEVGVRPTVATLGALADLVPIAVLAFFLATRTKLKIALPVLFGLLLLQRTIQDGGIYPVESTCEFYPRIPIVRRMQEDKEIFRMAGLHFAFLPDAAALYGLEDARGYEAMTFRRLFETYFLWSVHGVAASNNIPDKTKPFLNFLNVKYVIGSLDAQSDEQWKLVLEDRQSRLLENTRVMPRAFVPPWIRYEQDPSVVVHRMSQATEFSERAWIETRAYAPHDIANGPGTLTTRRNGTGFAIDAVMEREGWVVISETAWKGWRAYVDGKRVQVHYANHAFLGVFVPQGRHEVKVVYVPESFTRGRNISALTVAGLIGFFVWRRRRAASDVERLGVSA
ncbi:MAG TPA: YfhO family protein [Thermoanaerobaculia bacterium]|nr:YfhO family protein [Thermoanaerobaculia bacterium]